MWEPLLILLSFGLLAGAGLWHGRQGSHKQIKAWQDFAVSYGLEVVESYRFFSLAIKARAGRLGYRSSPPGRKGAPLGSSSESRLQGASPGQLSLTGAEAGQLSLAEAEAGQLSIATDPAGQLSIQPGEGGQLSISRAEDPPEET